MIKRIPDGMYFDCRNAVKRVAQSTLKNFLGSLGIKSAQPQAYTITLPSAGVISGKKLKVFLNGVELQWAGDDYS